VLVCAWVLGAIACDPPPEHGRSEPTEGSRAAAAAWSDHEDPVTVMPDPAEDAELRAVIEASRAQLPAIRARFRNGLPPGHRLLVKVKIETPEIAERVWVAVTAWSEIGWIDGTLANKPVIQTHQLGQPMRVREGEVIDWMIKRADGTREGNAVSRLLETRSQ